MQSVYNYPTKTDLLQAIRLGDEPWYQIFNLPGYRSEKNLEAVQATEDTAKLILGELFKREIKELSTKYTDNLEMIGSPIVYEKLSYWILATACETGAGTPLALKGKITENISDTDLETRTAPYYTNGGELYVEALKDPQSILTRGEDYSGYYHVHTNEQGEKVFMVGKEHLLSPHDILAPYVNKVKMIDGTGQRIGDIMGYGSSWQGVKPFKIEKYINIEGVKYDPLEALGIIKNNRAQDSLSQYYPGTLEIVYLDAEQTIPAGLKGHLGVRHGLEISCLIDGVYYPITSVEIDALDVPVGEFTIAEADSKLLLCLINKLIEEEKFRMLVEYIFPFNKFTAMTAIYNDMALFLSIGQKIYEEPENPTEPASGDTAAGFYTKPGQRFNSVEYASQLTDWSEGDPIPNANDFVGGNDGWASYKSRKPGFKEWLIGEVEWDSWDQIILRKSKKTIKNMFKNYYFARDFKPGDPLLEESPSQTSKRILKNYFIQEPYGKQLVGIRKRRKLRPNPFGKSDKECQKTDE